MSSLAERRSGMSDVRIVRPEDTEHIRWYKRERTRILLIWLLVIIVVGGGGLTAFVLTRHHTLKVLTEELIEAAEPPDYSLNATGGALTNFTEADSINYEHENVTGFFEYVDDEEEI